MSTAIDGLISGLNTTTIISQLMTLESAPQTALKAKVTSTGSFVTALQALNSKVSSLGDAAKTAATAASWQAVTTSSSATSVSATATTASQPSSVTFSIGSLASAQTSVSAAGATFAASFGNKITLATGSGSSATVKEIDLTGVTDLAGMAGAINTADAGVSASIVKVSATESRLQLTSKSTGVASGFDLYDGSVSLASVQGGSAGTTLMGRSAATQITGAADASITLWKGTPSETSVTSATNTFSGLLTGVDLTISKLETSPVTVTAARNATALQSLASGLVDNLSTVFAEIKSQTASTTTTDSTGRTLVKGGILSGDSAVRDLQQSVMSAASDPIDGISPSTMGLVLGKDGTITFDATIFAASLAADPAKVQSVITGLAARLQTVATNQSNATTGALSLKIKGQQTYVTTLNDQVSNWDVRLQLRQNALNKTYANLEVALGKLKSQSDWLTGQLATTSTTG
ncbi:flagellar filament capping protein FliD [Pengzhenrongella phosphoraccumulans]|uniref:flagellar filament capping protein FliD n=1 Tax=Pengzhenrongella phosphoraccumulans TaxID=3114394 RepID=UPI0038904A62